MKTLLIKSDHAPSEIIRNIPDDVSIARIVGSIYLTHREGEKEFRSY